MKNTKVFFGVGTAVVVVVALVVIVLKFAGGSLDVVGKQSITTFGTILQTIPENVEADDVNGGYALAAPDGSVRFIWSTDYSKSAVHDVMLELDAKPFIDAGLDAGKLPENYAAYEDKLMVGTKLGDDALTYGGEAAPLAAYEKIVEKYRSNINYHTALDHYGVMLGDGNMFEWAKDLSTNSTTGEAQDKDIVFVLNPLPLVAAGVNPEQVEGWAYAQVPTDDGDVWKLLKPFDLK
ncbi:MAG: hypothetical protein LBS18_00250 [Clostridiales bacterium]|jgi:hypothetical protein|nr:hypothetical protein [Clostridiales bacterium]